MSTPKYQLPDQGEKFVSWTEQMAGSGTAAAMKAEVDRMRLPDGALAPVALPSDTSHSPLRVLSLLLTGESVTLTAWAEGAFGRFERKSKRKELEQIYRAGGIEAGIDWVIANATKGSPRVDTLRNVLEQEVTDGVLGTDYLRADLLKRLRNSG